jgi:hypothetical protein
MFALVSLEAPVPAALEAPVPAALEAPVPAAVIAPVSRAAVERSWWAANVSVSSPWARRERSWWANVPMTMDTPMDVSTDHERRGRTHDNTWGANDRGRHDNGRAHEDVHIRHRRLHDDHRALITNRLVHGIDLHCHRASRLELGRVGANIPIDIALDLERRAGRWSNGVEVRSFYVAPNRVGGFDGHAHNRGLDINRVRAVVGVTLTVVPVGDRIPHKEIAIGSLPVHDLRLVWRVGVNMGEFDVAVAASVLVRDGMRPCILVLPRLGAARVNPEHSHECQRADEYSKNHEASFAVIKLGLSARSGNSNRLVLHPSK